MRAVETERNGEHHRFYARIIAVPETDRIIRIKTVLARTGLSRSTLYRKMAEGTFPKQLKLGPQSAGWHESAINAWIADPAGFGRKG